MIKNEQANIGKESCNKCGFALDIIEQSYVGASEGFRLDKMHQELQMFRNRMQGASLCPPLCVPAIQFMSRWAEFSKNNPHKEE